jgi:hypothetical protein
MLEPQVVVNLLPKLGIGADSVRHGCVEVLLAFFGFSPMRSHFWPFTEVVRKIQREVTRKVGKISDDPPSRSSYREQAAAFTEGYRMVNDPAITLSTHPPRFTSHGACAGCRRRCPLLMVNGDPRRLRKRCPEFKMFEHRPRKLRLKNNRNVNVFCDARF